MKTYVGVFMLLFISINTIAQQRVTATFGELTESDKEITVYDKDTEAAGVVLFESGYVTFEVVDRYIRLVTTVHRKIKVLDAKRFGEASVSIAYYKSESSRENVLNIKALTHTNGRKQFVNDAAIYTVDNDARWSAKRFTFPGIQNGSIIEYTYRHESPFFASLDGWEFQGKYPKLYSEFSVDIPGNYVYRRSLVGSQKLDVNESSVKKSCFYVPGTTQDADCDSATYAMFDIPAIEEEPYMLSIDNYKSRIAFQLQETYGFKGERTKYSREWKDVDREFKTEKDMGKQLKNVKFFEKALPASVKSIKDDLERAKAVYHYIQDHFNWDGKYRIFSEIRVRKAYEEGKGNIAEINLSLINALKAAKLDAYLMLSSTRKNGLPASVYPVLTDFNYVLALVKIGDQEYILDATDKFLAFGILPFKVLNIKGRVMDFKNGSYWNTIMPYPRNLSYTKVEVKAEDAMLLEGTINRAYSGYRAYNKRKAVVSVSSGDQGQTEETLITEVYDLKREGVTDRDEALKERGAVSIDLDAQGAQVYFNPFVLNTTFDENPFKRTKRQYPINLGHSLTDTYTIKIDLNNVFEVEELPNNTTYKLADNAGSFSIVYTRNEQILECSFTLKLNYYHYSAEAYTTIKQFFDHLVTHKTNATIKLKTK